MRKSVVRAGVARAATAGAAGLGAASVALGSLRWDWPGWVPVSSDTLAMAGAFTDAAVPGATLSALLAGTALALRPGGGRLALTALCVGATLAAVATVAPRWTGRAAAEPSGSTAFTVLSVNVRLGHGDPAALVAAAADADVVVLTEVTSPQVAAMDRLGFAERFPHRNEGRLPVNGGAGTAVWSRFPITSTRPLTPAIAHQSWATTLEVPGLAEPVTVLAVHPARPYRGGNRWLREQEALRAALPTDGRRVLLGDFNAVASHRTQRALRRDGWTSAVEQTGAGWVPTYPAGDARVPPLIDIDHVHLAPGLRATSLRTVAVPGADHLGLLTTVAVEG